MGVLVCFFEGKVDLEVSPGCRERAGAIIVAVVGGSILVLIFNKVEVPPYDEVGGGGDSFLEGRKLGGSGSKARRVQVEIEGGEVVCAVPSSELDAQGIAIERLREGDDFVFIKFVNVGGDNRGYPCRGLGETTETAGIV